MRVNTLRKKIFFLLLINIIILSSIEIIIKFSLKAFNYPTVYILGNIGDNRYNYLTGYYNLPNSKENFKKYYRQATDDYGFHLDGKRYEHQDLTEKDKCIFRIFLLGGSTVQGYGLVDRDDPISARLERTLDEKIGNSKLSF